MPEIDNPHPGDPTLHVDPELLPALELLPDMSSLSKDTLADWRAMLDAPREEVADGQNFTVEHVSIPGLGPTDPPIGALLYRPRNKPGKTAALLNLHGGGYVLGTAERDHANCAKLAEDLNCVVLSINYRRAPEHPYPAPLEDCYAALAWLHQNSNRLGVAPDRIGVRGWSAGGGLAAALALLARDRGQYPIRCLSLVYPMLDDRTSAGPVSGRFIWTEQANRFAWNSYLAGEVTPDEMAYAVPARAESLAGLPPTFIAVGSIDLFVAESVSFAKSLIDAGVSTELHVYPGAFHGFDLLAQSRLAQSFSRDQITALKSNLLHRSA